jgi:uncharacterized glyoxalase superfamily protein PhnB
MSESARPNIFPALRYRDATAAAEWLVRAFGFTERSVYRDENGIIRHAELQLGAGIVMFGQHSDDGSMGGKLPDALASPISLYVVVNDLDAHHRRATAAGADIVRDLAEMDYGSREYSARDPEGNLWSFGTYDPYQPAQQPAEPGQGDAAAQAGA